METLWGLMNNHEILTFLAGAGVFEFVLRKVPRVWPITKMVYGILKVGFKFSEIVYDGFSKIVEDK